MVVCGDSVVPFNRYSESTVKASIAFGVGNKLLSVYIEISHIKIICRKERDTVCQEFKNVLPSVIYYVKVHMYLPIFHNLNIHC